MTVPKPCPICHIPDKTQHSLREAGLCDAIRNGWIKSVNETPPRKKGKKR